MKECWLLPEGGQAPGGHRYSNLHLVHNSLAKEDACFQSPCYQLRPT